MRSACEDELKELLEGVRGLGFSVRNLAELRRVGNYKVLIPLLLRWLASVTTDNTKEDIIRTLSVPFAGSEVSRAFVAEFCKTEDFFLKWAIANGLSIVADDSIADDLLVLVQDKKHGRAREMLALALSRLKDPRARSVARGLLGDEDVQGHAAIALRKLKAIEAEEDVRNLLQHPKAWIRAEARKTLAAFEKVRRRGRAPQREALGRRS